jgi:hypothetical protein
MWVSQKNGELIGFINRDFDPFVKHLGLRSAI